MISDAAKNKVISAANSSIVAQAKSCALEDNISRSVKCSVSMGANHHLDAS